MRVKFLVPTGVGNGTQRHGGHHELHGLLEVDGLVEGSEGAEHQPRGADPSTRHEDPLGCNLLQSARFGVPHHSVRLAVDLLQMDGEHVGPIGDPLLGSETIECVGAGVDELVRAAGHAQAAAGALVGPEGQPGPAEGDAM